MFFKAIRIEDGLYEIVSEYDDGLHLRKLGAGALISLCFSFLCGISSILCCKEEISIFLHSCSMILCDFLCYCSILVICLRLQSFKTL